MSKNLNIHRYIMLEIYQQLSRRRKRNKSIDIAKYGDTPRYVFFLRFWCEFKFYVMKYVCN